MTFRFGTKVVKLDSDTPPPLHFSPTVAGDRGSESTAESTPVGTPRTQSISSPFIRRPERERHLYFSWHRKDTGPGANRSSAFLESDLLYPDSSGVSDCSRFSLFPETSNHSDTMATDSAPLDISPPSKLNTSSPGNRKSNLTFGLQQAGGFIDVQASTSSGGKGEGIRGLSFGRNDSVPMSFNNSLYTSGARPISFKDRPRRESNSGSYMTGISWGGVSVGSLIRDE